MVTAWDGEGQPPTFSTRALASWPVRVVALKVTLTRAWRKEILFTVWSTRLLLTGQMVRLPKSILVIATTGFLGLRGY